MEGDVGRDRYAVVENFFKRPKGWTFVEVADVSVDADDNVYVFNRGEHPMMVFDREGNFLTSWGEGQYPRAHGLTWHRTTRSSSRTTAITSCAR